MSEDFLSSRAEISQCIYDDATFWKIPFSELLKFDHEALKFVLLPLASTVLDTKLW